MKKLFALLLAVLMVCSLVACGAAQVEETPDPEKNPALASITVTVVHGNGDTKEFTYKTDEEFLGPLLEAEGVIEGNAGPYGMEITKVDGEQAIYDEDKAYWALYEGEEYALQGIDTTPIADGATYKLEYTGA